MKVINLEAAASTLVTLILWVRMTILHQVANLTTSSSEKLAHPLHQVQPSNISNILCLQAFIIPSLQTFQRRTSNPSTKECLTHLTTSIRKLIIVCSILHHPHLMGSTASKSITQKIPLTSCAHP